MCWHLYNVFFIPLFKGMETWRLGETLQHLNYAKTLLKLLRIKHFEFINNFHILEIFEYLEYVFDLYCEHNWLYIKSSNSNLFLCNLFV